MHPNPALTCDRYPDLSNAQDWAKKAGLLANKKKVMEGMLVFQTAPIHAPLTVSITTGLKGKELNAITKACKDNFEVRVTEGRRP